MLRADRVTTCRPSTTRGRPGRAGAAPPPDDFALLAVSLMLVSDSGSETGAASRPHVRSGAVSGAARNTLTSTYGNHQATYSNVCSVRIERSGGVTVGLVLGYGARVRFWGRDGAEGRA